MYRELDELEREDFTRLKMLKKKKEEVAKELAKAAAIYAKEAALLAQADSNLKTSSHTVVNEVEEAGSDAHSCDDKKKKKGKGKGKDKAGLTSPSESAVISAVESMAIDDDEDVVFK